MICHYIDVADGHGEHRSVPFRYVWPAELDLMAQIAGLRLRERWEGGQSSPSPTTARDQADRLLSTKNQKPLAEAGGSLQGRTA